eukprot:TRINITY_DN3252_c1_g2_i9.p1 TRINITY_DN3252_c1_g2~~TRINITY_DN3252_c1_g2_i9.p1  ORF type:complete len:239 (-),score=39.95 TRINITY_DN3252_c1_g2_i9:123-839(-)
MRGLGPQPRSNQKYQEDRTPIRPTNNRMKENGQYTRPEKKYRRPLSLIKSTSKHSKHRLETEERGGKTEEEERTQIGKRGRLKTNTTTTNTMTMNTTTTRTNIIPTSMSTATTNTNTTTTSTNKSPTSKNITTINTYTTTTSIYTTITGTNIMPTNMTPPSSATTTCNKKRKEENPSTPESTSKTPNRSTTASPKETETTGISQTNSYRYKAKECTYGNKYKWWKKEAKKVQEVKGPP